MKDVFSKERSERIDWIKKTLINPCVDLYQGWDKDKRCIDPNRRVAVMYEEFVVVIRIRRGIGDQLKADFVTAYLAGNSNSIGKIRAKPRWDKTKCR